MGAQRDYETVTRSLEGYLRERANEQRLRFHRDGSADSHVLFSHRHAFVSSAEVRDVLGEALDRGNVPPGEVASWAAHAAEAARDRALASVRDTLPRHARTRVADDPDGRDFATIVAELRTQPKDREEAFRTIVHEATRARGPIIDARAMASHVSLPFMALAEKRPDAIAHDSVSKIAADFLAATDELVAEARDYLEHRLRIPLTPATLLRALGAADLDDAFKTETFRPRMMGLASPMGLSEPLARRVHLEPPHGGAGFRTRLLYMDPPFDVRIAPTSMRGILGDISRIEAVGRAIATALVAASFSPAFRHPLEGTVSRTLGGLLVRLAFDRVRLGRERRLPDAVQDGARRIAAVTSLFALRLAASSVVHGEVSGEQASTVVERAVGLSFEEDIATLALAARSHAPRLVSGLAALSLFVRLRERFDEDFDRNPRSEDAIRGACERGGSVSVGVVLDELGGSVKHERALADWFHGY